MFLCRLKTEGGKCGGSGTGGGGTFKGNIQRKGSFKGWGSFIGLGGGGSWRTKVSFILVRGKTN